MTDIIEQLAEAMGGSLELTSSTPGVGSSFTIGLPIAIQTSTEVWAFSVATLMAGAIGPKEVAAHSISLNFAALSFSVALGIANGASIRVGNLIGARAAHTAQRAAWIAIAMGASVMSVSALIFALFRHELPRIYTDDLTVVTLAAGILPLAALFQIFLTSQSALSHWKLGGFEMYSGGFAWILLILGVAQCDEDDDRLLRFGYLAVFLLILLYTMPWGAWLRA